MSTERTPAQQHAKLHEIVKGCHTAMMVSRGTSGELHGRPMANADVPDDLRALAFATSRSSPKIDELARDDHVFLGYNNASGSAWASIAGRARIVDDLAKIKKLWNPFWKNWFEGPDDPQIILIEVTPVSAEYWDSGSRAIQMIKFALAAVTGKHFDSGENAKVM